MDPVLQSSAQEEKDFELDAKGWARRWKMEFEAARKELKKWHARADKIIKRYLDERARRGSHDTRWNLYAADVDTLEALLYGNTPSVDVARRFQDSQDDLARVAAIILSRMLNGDMERDNDRYRSALRQALQDHLLPGFGSVRLRYVPKIRRVPAMDPITDSETGQVYAEGVEEHDEKYDEDVETDYVYWKDQLWSPSRTFDEWRWWACNAPMTKDQIRRRWGKAVADKITVNARREYDGKPPTGTSEEGEFTDARVYDPWLKAEVWEIWDREHEMVFWYVEGHDEVLEAVPDPLKLEGFWPFPRPMIAGATNSKYVPRPDFMLVQDIDDEIDLVSTRITLLERAIRVVGLYDKTQDQAIERVLGEAAQNELIGLANWPQFQAKGGFDGVVAWFPIEQATNALTVLRDYRKELIVAHQQISGMSDIMRGEAAQTATATEQSIKARFGSVRIQKRQDEFARYASDVQRLRGEIVCKHFDSQTILERSNILNSPDGQMAEEAVKLLQSEWMQYRIQVKPESVSLQDWAGLKKEGDEVINSIGMYVQMVAPLAQQMPGAAPYLLEILQWYVSRLRGAQTMSGILERAINAAKMSIQQAMQNPQPQQPDPKMVVAMTKAKADIAKTQVHMQGELVKTKASSAARLAEIQAEKEAHIQELAVDHHLSSQAADADVRRDALREIAKVTNTVPEVGA